MHTNISTTIKHRNGFTLTELLVALSLFTAAIALVVGAFISALRTQRAVNELIGVNSNTSLVLEQMVREMRLGWDFTLSSAYGACDDTIEFVRIRGVATTTVIYAWDDVDLSVLRSEGVEPLDPLTDNHVAVAKLCFYKMNDNPNRDPSRITISLSVTSKQRETAANPVNIQTSVSGRLLPYEQP